MAAATVSVPAIFAVAASLTADAPALRVGLLTVDFADVFAADAWVRRVDVLRFGGALREAMVARVI